MLVIDDEMLTTFFPYWGKLTPTQRDGLRKKLGQYVVERLGLEPQDEEVTTKAPKAAPKGAAPKGAAPKGGKTKQTQNLVLNFLAKNKTETYRPRDIGAAIADDYAKIGFINPVQKQIGAIVSGMWKVGMIKRHKDSTYGFKK